MYLVFKKYLVTCPSTTPPVSLASSHSKISSTMVTASKCKSLGINTINGGHQNVLQTFTPTTSQEARQNAQRDLQAAYDALPATARAAFNQMHNIADPLQDSNPSDWDDVAEDDDDIAAAIGGQEGFESSGAGGKFRDVLEAAMRKEQAVAFTAQMDAISDAYVDWAAQIDDYLDKPLPPPPSHLVHSPNAIHRKKADGKILVAS
ncbi:hypothetical protein B0H10DRAFT_1972473 [Mycena sp. CBHHK59/15]|nr:hypothetical protein B0H10DRAFT_1972473 [Mycena sp. CBHHK59/15]